MKVTYFGQNGFHFSLNGYNIVVDPFISGNPQNSKTQLEDVQADYILITHGHLDHVGDVEAIAKANDAMIIANYEVVMWFSQKGLKGHPMNHGGKHTFPFGEVKFVNAVHSSNMPDGSYGGNPGGFVVWNNDVSFYIAGDTALTMDMKLIPMTCPKLDFAILPIGDNFTMGYEDAAIAADFIACNKIIGCHYDTFAYIEIDHDAALKTFEGAGKELILIEPGDFVEV